MKKLLTITAVLIATALPCIAQVINNPYVGASEDRSTTIKRIETNSKYTIVSFETTAGKDNSWVQVNKEIYLQTDISNAHYDYIKSENIAIVPVKQTLSNAGDKLVFRIYFKKIPAGVKSINIIERAGSGNGDVSYFNYYNVSLTQSAPSQYATNTGQHLVERVITDSVRMQPPIPVHFSDLGVHNESGNAIDVVNSGMPGEIGNVMNSVMPMMRNMAKIMMDAQLEYYKQPGKMTEVAKLNKEYYDALKKEGFTGDEALKIITADGIMPKATAMSNR